MQYRSALDVEHILAALKLLRAEGYTTLSLSGGEPLVYRSVQHLVAGACDLGLKVSLITNGLLANERHDATLEHLHGVAISFDGLAATHDRMRARPGAFDAACRTLARLADRGWNVAAAISLSSTAIQELPELAEQLVEHGAQALQIRPIAVTGRARTMSDLQPFTEADLSRLYLVCLALGEELANIAHVACDLSPAWGLWQQRDAYAALLQYDTRSPGVRPPLSDLVNPLVITDEGILKPITYDFPHRFDIAPLNTLAEVSIQEYVRSGLPAFQQLVAQALDACSSRNGLVDWFDLCTRTAELHRPTADALGQLDANRPQGDARSSPAH